ncbi:MAG: hypothetical protein JWM91_5426 [Rhodospirillales bacterium]|nr:hypothetical protein [Rhodospirillales bacterium]
MTEIAATPARMTAIKTRLPIVRSKERVISSIANTIPASGVLKAAATPAAPPAKISPFYRPMPVR